MSYNIEQAQIALFVPEKANMTQNPATFSGLLSIISTVSRGPAPIIPANVLEGPFYHLLLSPIVALCLESTTVNVKESLKR